MQNADTLRSVYESSANDYQGSAQQELDKYLDSITAKLQKFTNEVHSFWTGLIDSNVVKFFIDLGAELLKLVNTFGQLKTAIVAISAIITTKNLGFGTVFVDGKKQLTLFNRSLKEMGEIFKANKASGMGFAQSLRETLFPSGTKLSDAEITQLKNIHNQMQQEFAKDPSTFNFDNVWESANVASEGVDKLDDSLKRYLVDEKGAIVNNEALSNTFAKTAGVGVKFGNTLKSLAAGLANAAMTAVVTIAISTAIKALDNLIHRVQRTKETVDSLLNEYKSAEDTFNSHKKTVDEIAKEYTTLSGGVDKLGRNVSLTSEEYAKYQEYTQQIADMFPSLISGYTSTGDAIVYMADATTVLNNALDKEQEVMDKKLINGMDDVIDNYDNYTTKLQNLDVYNNIVDAVLDANSVAELSDKINNLITQSADILSQGRGSNILEISDLIAWDSLNEQMAANLGKAWFNDDGELVDRTTRSALLSKLKGEILSIEEETQPVLQATSKTLAAYMRQQLRDNDRGIFNDLIKNSELIEVASNIVSNLSQEILDGFNGDTDVAQGFITNLLAKFNNAASDPESVKKLSASYGILFGNALKDKSGNILSDINPAEYAKIINDTIGDMIESLGLDPDVFTNVFRNILNVDEIEAQSKEYNRVISNIMLKFGNQFTTPLIEDYIKTNKLNSVSAITDFWEVLINAYNDGSTAWGDAIDVWEKTVEERFSDTEELLPFSSLFSADSEIKDQIDSFKTDIQKIGEAIANFSSLSPDDKLGIYESFSATFPQIIDGSELTVEALQRLANAEWNLIDTSLSGVEGADNYKAALRELMNQAINTGKGFKESLKNIGLPQLTEPTDERTDVMTYVKQMDECNRAFNDYENGYKKLLDYTKRFTDAQKESWTSITAGAKSADEAIQMYDDYLHNLPYDNIQDVLADEVFLSLKLEAEDLRDILDEGITLDERQTLLERWGLTSTDLQNGAALELQGWLNRMVKLYAEAGGEAGKEWYKSWVKGNQEDRDSIRDQFSGLGGSIVDRHQIRNWVSDLTDSDIESLGKLKIDIDQTYTLDQIKEMLRNAKKKVENDKLLDIELRVNNEDTTLSSYISEVQSKAQTLQTTIFSLMKNRDGTRDKMWSDIAGDYDTYSALASIVPDLTTKLSAYDNETEQTEAAIALLTTASENLFAVFNNEISDITEINNLSAESEATLQTLTDALKDLTDVSIQSKNGLKYVADSLDKIYFDDVAEDARSFAQVISDTEEEINTLNSAYTQLIDSNLRENSVEFKQLVADLVQQFPQLADSTGSIQEMAAAVANLMNVKGDNLIIALEALKARSGIPESLVKSIDAVIDSFHRLGTQPFSMDNAMNVIRNARSELNQLAEFVRKVNETGLHLDIDATDDVYNLYPELLKNATIYKDGTIELNKEVYESFKQAKQLEVQGDIDARIKELEAANAQAQAEINFEKSKLAIVNEALKSKSTAKMQIALAEIEAMEAEAQADAETKKDMAQNDADLAEQALKNTELKKDTTDEAYNENGETAADYYTQVNDMDQQETAEEVKRSDDETKIKVDNMGEESDVFGEVTKSEAEQDEALNEQKQENSVNTTESQQENELAEGKTALSVMSEESATDEALNTQKETNSEVSSGTIIGYLLDILKAATTTATEASGDSAGAWNNARENAATATDNIANSMNGIINKAHNVALAVAGMLNGKVQGSSGEGSGSDRGSGALTGFLKTFGGTVSDYLGKAFSGVKDSLIGALGNTFNALKTSVPIWNPFGGGAKTNEKGISSFAVDLTTKLTSGIAKGVQSAGDFVEESADKLANFISGVSDGISNTIEKASEFYYKVKDIDPTEAVSAFLDGVKKIGDRLTGNNTPKESYDRYKDLVTRLTKIADASNDRIEELMRDIANNNEIIEWLKANGGLDLADYLDRINRENGNNGGDSPSGRDSSPDGGSGSRGSDGSDKADEEAEQYSEVIDWIEVRIQRLERVINKLDKVAGNSFENFQTRNKAIGMEIEAVKEEFDDTAKAFKRYMAEADAVPLSEEFKEKVRKGVIDIETITDENLKKNIEEYQTWLIIATLHGDMYVKFYLIAGNPLEVYYHNIMMRNA